MKGDFCYEGAEELAELCSSIGWKVELTSEEHEYLAEEVSKQSVKDSAWFLLAAYNKMGKGKQIEE